MGESSSFTPGAIWPDTNGVHINAHGGGMLYQDGTYYWFGEKRGRHASEGINAYSSQDLYNWRHEGVALAPAEGDPEHDITRGCVMERPKVLHNEKTGRYVMWFHLELKGQGYRAARAAVATSDTTAGPYRFVRSLRPNGNMSRDMTLFEDDDGAAYHVFASRDNYDMRVCRLSDDYLSPTEEDVVIHSDHREAPALFKHRGRYYLITSGCTGWEANEARLDTADSIWGPWRSQGNPARGPRAETTFDSQSTHVLPVEGREGAFIFMADRWSPQNLADSRYVWLPMKFEGGGAALDWLEEWDLSWFDERGGSDCSARRPG
jgi:beta-galactosidase